MCVHAWTWRQIDAGGQEGWGRGSWPTKTPLPNPVQTYLPVSALGPSEGSWGIQSSSLSSPSHFVLCHSRCLAQREQDHTPSRIISPCFPYAIPSVWHTWHEKLHLICRYHHHYQLHHFSRHQVAQCSALGCSRFASSVLAKPKCVCVCVCVRSFNIRSNLVACAGSMHNFISFAESSCLHTTRCS